MLSEYNSLEIIKIVRAVDIDIEKQGWSHIKTEIDPTDSDTLRALFTSLSKQFTQNKAIKPEVTSLSPKERSTVLATSSKAMSFHTDNVYLEDPCKAILLFCAEQADEGGENELVDGVIVAKSLPSDIQESLKESKWQWTNPVQQQASSEFTILDQNVESIRWWRMSLLNSDPGSVAVADFLEEALNNSPNKHTLLMQPGDVLLADNTRILHSRSPFVGSRQMYRARFW